MYVCVSLTLSVSFLFLWLVPEQVAQVVLWHGAHIQAQ